MSSTDTSRCCSQEKKTTKNTSFISEFHRKLENWHSASFFPFFRSYSKLFQFKVIQVSSPSMTSESWLTPAVSEEDCDDGRPWITPAVLCRLFHPFPSRTHSDDTEPGSSQGLHHSDLTETLRFTKLWAETQQLLKAAGSQEKIWNHRWSWLSSTTNPDFSSMSLKLS